MIEQETSLSRSADTGKVEGLPDTRSSLAWLLGIWAPIGLAAAMFIVLQDISGLLGSISSSSGRSYTTAVIAGFDPTLGTGDLKHALELWLGPDGLDFGARRLLRWFVFVDLVFIVAYTRLAWLLLQAIGVRPDFVRNATKILLTLDSLETLLTWFIIEQGETGVGFLLLVRILSLAKWFAVISIAIVAAVWWLSRKKAERTAAPSPAIIARSGGDQSYRIALVGQTVLVGIFVLLIAYPAGGPLQQIPDLLRYQLHGAPWHVWILSAGAQTLLTLTVAASAFVGARSRGTLPRLVFTSRVFLGVGLFTAVFVVLGYVVDRRFNIPALAPVLLVGLIVVADWLAKKAGFQSEPLPRSDARPTTPSTLTVEALTWAGALSGAVMVAMGLGGVRASATFLLLNEGSPLRWWTWATAGLLLALFGGGATQWLVVRLGSSLTTAPANAGDRDLIRWLIIATFVVTASLGLFITLSPAGARHFGGSGTLALSFGVYAIAIAGLQWLSRRGLRWSVATSVGLGARTPWAGMLVAAWALSSVLNTAGGYHDARTETASGGSTQRYENIKTALTAWSAAQDLKDCPATDAVPLVMVAAPGGGIRAAYWTATAVQRIFPDDCARSRLFALSGTSGGSVGGVVWQAATDQGVSPKAAISNMSGDEAIAATLGGMLLRDLPQPLTGVAGGWRDRAALLEDGWIEQAGVLGTKDAPTPWSDLGDKTAAQGWAPILILNSSSVTDGCRVLVTNAGGLPTATNADCLSTTGVGGGPSRAAIAPLPRLTERDGEKCGDREPTAVTASLLSARFPFITPSGALHHCDPNNSKEIQTTYAVDGGYYENSGLLALLEILQETEDMSIGGLPVQPWIVLVDNHYRSDDAAPAAERPNELFVPLLTVTSSKLGGQTALEQAATTALREDADSCPHFGRIGPTRSPGVAAPLGWVLSEASRESLKTSLDDALLNAVEGGDSCLKPLLEALGSG